MDPEETIIDRGDDFVPDNASTDDSLDTTDTTEPGESSEQLPEGDTTPETSELDDKSEPELAKTDGDTPTDEPVKEAADVSIPKSRFDEVNNKRKEAEDRLRDMETQMAILNDRQQRVETKPEEVKVEALDRKAIRLKINEAILDGDGEAASDLQDQLDQDVIQQTRAYADQKAVESSQQTVEERKFAQVADEIVASYDEFKTGNDKYDQSLLDEVVELKDAFISTGMASNEALVKAANIATRGLEKAGAVAAVKEPVVKKQTDVAKNLETQKKQPPIAEVGDTNGSTSLITDVAKMSDIEFAALPASKLAELRGDVL